MIAYENDYKSLWGNISVTDVCSMARCACVACNSCTCACSCRVKAEYESIEW